MADAGPAEGIVGIGVGHLHGDGRACAVVPCFRPADEQAGRLRAASSRARGLHRHEARQLLAVVARLGGREV